MCVQKGRGCGRRRLWLDADIDCGERGNIIVKNSKTDYVIMMEEAWDQLHALEESKIPIAGGHLIEALPFIIGFYEVRTQHGRQGV